jgi:Beta-glucosidase (SUN family)
LNIQAAVATAILLLSSSPCEAKHGHQLQHLDVFAKRHNHKIIHASPHVEGIELELEKRGGQCQFPNDAGLVAVTPGAQNAGWAMSPDQPCQPLGWCPYACPSGQVMAQWNPLATSYTYPLSQVRSLSTTLQLDTEFRRMEVCFATSLGPFKSRSPTSHTA